MPSLLPYRENAYVERARTHAATVWTRRDDSAIYNVTGPLTGPSGRTIQGFISAWELRDGSRAPRNVTVLAARRGRR